jgi:hypothetical protein
LEIAIWSLSERQKKLSKMLSPQYYIDIYCYIFYKVFFSPLILVNAYLPDEQEEITKIQHLFITAILETCERRMQCKQLHII